MKNRLFFLGSIAALLLLSSPAFAMPTLWISDENGNLGTVDVSTQVTTVIGNMGIQMSDIAFDGDGNLYGISLDSLYSIDSTTAVTTFLGNHDVTSTGNKNSLVFDANGNLYAANDALYTLSITTGWSTLLGSGGAYDSSGDLAFINGDLFLSSKGGAAGSDRLFKLDTTNGAGTFIGDIGYADVFGLATADNVFLYGISDTSILTINSLTGDGAFLFDYSGNGLGKAWGSAFETESDPVPEPATMALFGFGLAGLASTRFRKKKK